MQQNISIIWRHRRENLKKCSLRGLEGREDMRFITYPTGVLPNLTHYLFLTLDAPPLTAADAGHGLFFVDATWRRAEQMIRQIPKSTQLIPRSLPPHFQTAYPRRQEDCIDPARGLATVEALFLAYHLLGYPKEGLLDHYHWKESFLSKNKLSFEPCQLKGMVQT